MANPFDLNNMDDFNVPKTYLRDGEIMINGIPSCPNCKTYKRWISPTGEWCISACRCEQEKEMKSRKMIKIEELRKRYSVIAPLSILKGRYTKTTFKTTNTNRDNSFKEAIKECKAFCEEERKLGLYIYGSVGTGKTHLLACMAHEIRLTGKPVLVTKLSEICDYIRSSYKKDTTIDEDVVLKRLYDIPYLFLDDLGEDNFKKDDGENFTQNILKDILDNRYRRENVTCFSSNYSIGELINRGTEERTVDRIVGMSKTTLKINGSSYRLVERKEND